MRWLLSIGLLTVGGLLLLLSCVLGVVRRQAPQVPYVVYTSDVRGNYEVYRKRPDGSHLRNLTRHPSGDSLPLWSPTSEQIAFISNRDGNFEVYVVGAHGWRVRNISQDPSDDTFPQWSPDGRWIAFETHHPKNREIYRVRPDGSGKRNLTQNPAHDWFPGWSKDGEWIYFMSNRAGDSFNYQMRPDGSQAGQIPAASAAVFYSEQQSPIIDLVWNPRYTFYGGIMCLMVAGIGLRR